MKIGDFITKIDRIEDGCVRLRYGVGWGVFFKVKDILGEEIIVKILEKDSTKPIFKDDKVYYELEGEEESILKLDINHPFAYSDGEKYLAYKNEKYRCFVEK